MLLLLLSLFLMIACSKEDENVNVESLYPSDSFTVPFKNANLLGSDYLHSYWGPKGKSYYLTFLNPYTRRVRFFKFSKDSGLSIFKKIKIPVKLIGRLGFFAYYIKNLDSIYLFPDDPGFKNRNKLSLINGKGNLLNHWQITQKLENGNEKYSYPGEYFKFPRYITLRFLKDTFVIKNKPGVYPDYVKEGQYLEGDLDAVINNKKELVVIF